VNRREGLVDGIRRQLLTPVTADVEVRPGKAFVKLALELMLAVTSMGLSELRRMTDASVA